VKRLLPLLLLAALLALTGCGGKKRVRVAVPPPPPVAGTQPEEETPSVRPNAQPIFTEVGYASWYGGPYHNRRAANGEIYDMNALTAAHRTLPLNSVVRVTNLKTQQSVLVRITDRGPFVPDRIIDLSAAAARKIDVWRPGTAKVRVDVLDTPKPIETGGRWCVQIGSIEDQQTARELQEKLARRYKTAKVLAFSGPMHDWWVRVRVLDDSKRRAEQVIQDNSTPEGNMFLVRLD
jgi:rare lipoprotein A